MACNSCSTCAKVARGKATAMCADLGINVHLSSDRDVIRFLAEWLDSAVHDRERIALEKGQQRCSIEVLELKVQEHVAGLVASECEMHAAEARAGNVLRRLERTETANELQKHVYDENLDLYAAQHAQKQARLKRKIDSIRIVRECRDAELAEAAGQVGHWRAPAHTGSTREEPRQRTQPC